MSSHIINYRLIDRLIKSISNIDNYEYDNLGALTKTNKYAYTYDAVSNRKSESIGGQLTSYIV